MFKGAEEKSKNLSREFRLIAGDLGCEFLDTADVIISSQIDAIHLDAEEHDKLGQAVAARVREIFEA